jgi:hypothetical protein
VPDLLVALGRPDDGPFDAVQLVPQPRHVERQAVLEDRPVAVLLVQGGVAGGERVGERAVRGDHPGRLGDHDVEEVPGLRDRRGDLGASAAHRAPPADQRLGVESGYRVEGRAGPFAVERVAGVERGLRLHEVAGEEDPLARNPRDEVALRVPATAVLQHQVPPIAAEVDRQAVGERHRRPGQPGHRLGLLGQPRHPRELRRPVLLAALRDERTGVLVRDDHVGLERGRAEHPYCVVVREHQVAHRLVGVRPEPGQPLPGRDGCGERFDADDEVLALDRTDVGVALSSQRVHPFADHLQGLRLGGEVLG